MTAKDFGVMWKIGKGIATIAAVLFLIFAPFFAVVRKEKMFREIAKQRDVLRTSLQEKKSCSAALELRISELTSTERLELYARDTLGLTQADPRKVIAVERDADGSLLVGEKKRESFFYKLMGKQ